jgi:hypothetical protein
MKEGAVSVIARFVSALIDTPEPRREPYTARALYESYKQFHARFEEPGTPLLTFEAFDEALVMAIVEYEDPLSK